MAPSVPQTPAWESQNSLLCSAESLLAVRFSPFDPFTPFAPPRHNQGTLTNGSVYFSDPQRTNYTARFYRLRSP
jgi:hypothetical protein